MWKSLSNDHRYHPPKARHSAAYARAFEQIDQSLAINSNKSKLERKLWLRRQSMRRAYYASVEKIRVNPAKSGF
jgi:hypothetical protein